MADTNFYQYKDGKKTELCKTCLTAHINNWEPETFLWLLEKFDVPYIEAEWNVLRDRAYNKDPVKFGPMSVFGKYLSKMKLNQWKNFTWADTEKLKLEAEEKAKLYGGGANQAKSDFDNIKEAYENGEISEAQYQTYAELNKPEKEFVFDEVTKQVVEKGTETTAQYPINNHPFEVVDLPDPTAELTQEDKIYLAMKWGQLYSAADWIKLEEQYIDYEKSFDLHNADLIRGTKELCKLDLKGDQALDTGDFDSYSKIARAKDTLRKSLKFTEAQRKEDKESEFSCYGQIVSFAEENNDEDYIPNIDLSVDRDMVDIDIRDMKNYTKTLIEDDPAVFKMIEQYIKKREILAEQERDAEGLEDGEVYELSDEEMSEYNQNIEQQIAEDDNYEKEEEDDDE